MFLRIGKLLLYRRLGKHIAQSILRLIEQWTSALDNINFISEVLMNLSEAFDYISHDIFITKLHARSFSENSLKTINFF